MAGVRGAHHRATRLIAVATLLLTCTVLVTAAAAPVDAAGPPPATWRMVALGDSIPYGGSYCGWCTSYVVLFARAVAHASGHPLAVINDGSRA